MKSKENLVFLGMMGSGKSTIGLFISKKLKLDFFDIDREIENELGMKIPEIFKDKGEVFFRKIEEKITLKFLKKNSNIISLGGGAFLNKTIQREVLDNHISFWLRWNSTTLINRIKNNKKRPLAINNSKSQLFELIKKRTNIYEKAMYKIDCENLTKNEIVKEVLNIYEKH